MWFIYGNLFFKEIMKYKEYAKTYHEIVDTTRVLNIKKRNLEELINELKEDGKYGLEFTSHGFSQIAEKLEDLAGDNQMIYNDVIRPDSPQDALIIPSNLKSFVISLLSMALEEGNVVEKDSRTKGKEFHYITVIKKWLINKKVIEFTCIVENNCIKTGYFNYVDFTGEK
jgi:hypothetical protein